MTPSIPLRPVAIHGHDIGYRRMLEDLGIASYKERKEGCARARAMLPALRTMAEEIMAANPEIMA